MKVKELSNHSETIYPSLNTQCSNVEYRFDEIENTNYEFDELQKIEKFFSYLKTLSRTDGKPSLVNINRAEEFLISLLSNFGHGYIYPLVSSNTDGDILFSYNTDELYLGIRICDDSLIEIFFKDFVDGGKEFEEFNFIEDAVNSEIVDGFFKSIIQ